LVRIEVELAKDDLGAKLTDAKRAAILFLASAIGGTVTLALLLTAIALATPMPWLAAAILGAALLVASVVLAVLGVRAMPARPLQPTRERIDASIDTIKERIT
ncbi:MAG TPA: phage holin family protein, partial [Polyangiaceae bacterium]|nr:phage holin family protein [Polyangiaceae bacterium]